MLDGLMGGSVFPYSNRVMGHHPDHRKLHQRGHAHGRTQIVGEHEERRAERSEPSMGGDRIAGCAHGMFTHPKVDV